MRFLHTVLLLALMPVLVGSVSLDFPKLYSEQPLGKVAVLKPEEWNGVWMSNGHEYERFVVDAEKGELKVSDACNRENIKKLLPLRRVGPWFFFSGPEQYVEQGQLKDRPYSRTDGFMLRHKNALISYFPDPLRARDLVEQGKLPGRIQSDKVILGVLTPEHFKALLLVKDDKWIFTEKNDVPAVFWHPIVIWIKLPDAFDPCKKGERPK